jgi:hypothetical protein
MITTTINKIRKHGPCKDGWEKLLKHLNKTQADDEPLPLVTILENNGLDDALWCLRAVDGHDREIRLYAVDCACRVQHLMKDRRSINALDVAERYANGEATDKELKAGYEAARAAWINSWSAGRIVMAAAEAAWSCTWDSAYLAAWSSVVNAAAERVSKRQWQTDEFKRRFG